MSARIRGATTELEELGEEETITTSKLRDMVKSMTGFDIMIDSNTFKDVYEIVLGIGKEWDKLTDIEQASLGEALAGKRNANAFYAAVKNLDTLQAAYETAENSAGSAMREQENYAKSIQYSLDKTKASAQELANDLISSGTIKWFVDFGNSAVNVLDSVIKNIGSLRIATSALFGVFQKKTGFATFKTMDSDLANFLETVNPGRKGKVKNILGNIFNAPKQELLYQAFDNAGLSTYFDKSIIQDAIVELNQLPDSYKTIGDAINNVQDKTSNYYKLLSQLDSKLPIKQAKDKLNILNAQLEKGSGLALKFGKALGSIGINLGISLAITAITALISEIANAENKLRDLAKSTADTFKQNTQAIEDYQSRIAEYRETLDSPTSSYEERVEAYNQINSIQDELLEKYGKEVGAINAITDAVNGVEGAWEKVNELEWGQRKREINEGDYNFGEGLTNWWNQLTTGTDNVFDSIIARYENSVAEFNSIFSGTQIDLFENAFGNNFESKIDSTTGMMVSRFTGTAAEISDILQDISFNSSFYNLTEEQSKALEKQLYDVQELDKAYGELYNQHVLNDVILNVGEYGSTLKTALDDVTKAKKNYDEAMINGDDGAEAAEAYVSSFNEVISKLKADDSLDPEIFEIVKQYLYDLYPELQGILDDWNLTFNITPNIDSKALLKQVDVFGSKEELANALNGKFTPNASDTQRQAADYIKNVVTEGFEGNIDWFFKYLDGVRPIFSQALKDTVRDITDNLDLTPQVFSAWASKLNTEDLNIVSKNQVDFDKLLTKTAKQLGVNKNSITAYNKTLDKLKDKLAETAKEQRSFIDALSDTVEKSDELSSIQDIYDDIYDGGDFDFGKLFSEDLKLDVDTKSLDKFRKAITDSFGDIKAAQGAFDELVDAWMKGSGVLEDLSEANKEAWIQTYAQKGISNAREIADAYLDTARAAEEVEESFNSLRDAYNNNKAAANDLIITADNLSEATYEELSALIDFEDGLDSTEAALIQYWIAKNNANLITLITSGDISNLESLCEALGISIDYYNNLAQARANYENAAAAANSGKTHRVVDAMWDRNSGPTIESSAKSFANAVTNSITSSIPKPKFNGGSARNTGGGSSGGSSNSEPKEEKPESTFEAPNKEDFDWVEKYIAKIETRISDLDKIINGTYHDWTTRTKHLNEEIERNVELLDAEQKAMEVYQDKANSVGREILGMQNDAVYGTYIQQFLNSQQSMEDIASILEPIQDEAEKEWLSHLMARYTAAAKFDAEYRDKVIAGTLEVESVDDEVIKEIINEWQTWYDKKDAAERKLQDIRDAIQKLNAQKLDNLIKQFDQMVDRMDFTKNLLDKYIERFELQGLFVSEKMYEAQLDYYTQKQKTLEKEYNKLAKEIQKQVAAGQLGGEELEERREQLRGIQLELAGITNSIIEINNAIRQLDWDYFDFMQDKIGEINEESEFLIRLMSNKKLYEDNGQLTNEGWATMGLHGLEYNVYMQQADRYAQELKKIEGELAKDPYNKDLINRRKELLKLQRDSILAAEDQKNAIKDMVEEGIKLELDNVKNLISEYEKLLDAQKDYIIVRCNTKVCNVSL